MLLTTEYAIRALVVLAAAGRLMFARNVAREAKIPPYFLAKILQNLARLGILRSMKGPSGGFMLALDASEITIAAIVYGLEGRELSFVKQRQFIGPKAVEAIQIYQTRTTIADLVRQHRRAA